MDCFSSSDAAAKNATVVFDFNVDEGNLWSRSNQDVPLPLCSSTSAPLSDSKCNVCVDEKVFAVCRNLSDGAEVTMESVRDYIKISKSECPRLLSDDASQWKPPILIPIIIIIIILLLILILYLVIKYKKRCQNPEESRQEEIQMHEGNESSSLTDETS